MGGFHRDNPLFSLCGLNCGLCRMYGGGYCPGCGGEGKSACAMEKRLSINRGLNRMNA